MDEGPPHPANRRTPILLIALSGYAVLLGLIWLDEAVDLPRVLLDAPASQFCWQAALFRSVVLTGFALLMVILLASTAARLRRISEEQRGSERALATSAAHLRRAQEVASLGSWDLDLVTGNLFWSDEVCRIFGVPAGAAPDYEGFLAAVHPEDREDVDRAWRAALGGAPYDIEHRVRVDGEIRWVREKAQVEFDETGRALRGIGIVQDITMRKSAAEEAARLEAELAHVTRVTTLGEFSAALAHELNQPLAAMLSNAQAAKRFLDRETPDLGQIREILDDIVADDQRASGVIRKLRELSRKPVGDAEPSPLEVNPLIEGVLRIVRGDLALRRVALSKDLAEGLAPVSANAIQLQQALLNFVLNALEAMEGSPVRRLTLSTGSANGGTVDVIVSDTGPGLDPAAAERLFDPFFTTKEKGLGMGLTISRSLVEAHGGSIRAEAAPGGGARFVISLPVREGGE